MVAVTPPLLVCVCVCVPSSKLTHTHKKTHHFGCVFLPFGPTHLPKFSPCGPQIQPTGCRLLHPFRFGPPFRRPRRGPAGVLDLDLDSSAAAGSMLALASISSSESDESERERERSERASHSPGRWWSRRASQFGWLVVPGFVLGGFWEECVWGRLSFSFLFFFVAQHQ